MSLADLFPPGTDLCQLPSGYPPKGQTPDFVNPPSQRDLTIGLSVSLTALATVFTLGRLYGNARKKLTWLDGLVALAIVCSIAEGGTMIAFAHYFRHAWDVPICWIDRRFIIITFLWEMLYHVGQLCSKAATLLLFSQIFTVSERTRLAIRLGLGVIGVVYAVSIGALSYAGTPHIGQSWDDVVFETFRHRGKVFAMYWAMGLGVVGTVIDMYIFVVPLPVLSKLQLSVRRRIQLFAVFLTGFFAVLASALSLVYRVRLMLYGDETWYTGAQMNCNLAEMNMACIVASAPGFAGFLRTHVSTSRLVVALRSIFGGNKESALAAFKAEKRQRDLNQRQTGHQRQGPREGGQTELGNSRLSTMGSSWNVEAGEGPPETGQEMPSLTHSVRPH